MVAMRSDLVMGDHATITGNWINVQSRGQMVHSKAPWRVVRLHYSVPHAIVDADGRILCGHVRDCDGPLMAAAPTMFAVLRRIASRLSPGDELGDLARRAIAVVVAEQRPDP